MAAKKTSPESETVGSTPPKTKEERLENYSNVVERAELSLVQLVDLTFDVDPNHFKNDPENKPVLTVNVEAENVFFNGESGDGGIFLLCEAGSYLDDKALVHCKARYLVSYDNLEGCEHEAATAFLRRVGRFACYPYFRSLFSTLDWSANTDMPVLPVLKEPVKPKSRRQRASQITPPSKASRQG
ncbi:MAG: hypothetical protein ABJP87_00355 [Bauldia litoralis]|uniref:hypothetical protein n=1 Tax=Bauldia litoralis TaxID=665467 RepID=UPI003298A44F